MGQNSFAARINSVEQDGDAHVFRSGGLRQLNRLILKVALFYFLPSLFLGLIAGFGLLGPSRDYWNYLHFYETIRNYSDTSYFRFEPGFVLLATFFKVELSANLETFLAFLATTSILIKLAVFSEWRRPVLIAIFYIFCFFPLHEYTQIRASAAFAFSFLSLKYFFDGKYVKYFIVSVVAFFFHASTLMLVIAIPGAYFLSGFRLPFSVAVVAVVGALVSFIDLIPIAAQFNPAVNFEYVSALDGSGVNLLSPTNIVTVLLMASMLFSGAIENRRDKTCFILAAFGMLVMISFLDMPIFAHRLKEALVMFLVPLSFNFRLTPRAFPQLLLSITLAVGTVYASFLDGIIGAVS